MKALSKRWHEKIPPLSCIVLSKKTGLPGRGFGFFTEDKAAFRRKSKSEQKRLVDAELLKITTYSRWPDVLKAYGVSPTPALAPTELKRITALEEHKRGGESESHRLLKEYIAGNPGVIGASKLSVATTEYRLPSADEIDVLFKREGQWIGVEVKSSISNEDDLARGMFQVVKYEALLKAEQKSLQMELDVEVLLVYEGELTPKLERLRTTLGLNVLQVVCPR